MCHIRNLRMHKHMYVRNIEHEYSFIDGNILRNKNYREKKQHLKFLMFHDLLSQLPSFRYFI